MAKTTVAIPNIIGKMKARNSSPNTNAMEHITSANIINDSEIVPPTPRGSGNAGANLLNEAHLSMPWLMNINPNMTRAISNMAETVNAEGGVVERNLLIFMANTFEKITPSVSVLFFK